jgi:hypothetical protein
MERVHFHKEVTMYRAATIALASAFLILAPTELLARGGGGGHGVNGGHAAFSGGHGGHMYGAQAGRFGFQAMPRNFFEGGYYWGCFPIWNGYAWVNYCGYNY